MRVNRPWYAAGETDFKQRSSWTGALSNSDMQIPLFAHCQCTFVSRGTISIYAWVLARLYNAATKITVGDTAMSYVILAKSNYNKRYLFGRHL